MKLDMNKDYVITINREVGSGGRTVSRMLAQRLGVPFYGRHHLLQHGEGREVRVAPHFRFSHLHQPR